MVRTAPAHAARETSWRWPARRATIPDASPPSYYRPAPAQPRARTWRHHAHPDPAAARRLASPERQPSPRPTAGQHPSADTRRRAQPTDATQPTAAAQTTDAAHPTPPSNGRPDDRRRPSQATRPSRPNARGGRARGRRAQRHLPWRSTIRRRSRAMRADGRQRYLQVRGSGFDAWASQRLQGAVLDGAGQPRMSWSSVWVSPQGRLTLEIGLCPSAFRGRGALDAGQLHRPRRLRRRRPDRRGADRLAHRPHRRYRQPRRRPTRRQHRPAANPAPPPATDPAPIAPSAAV